MAELADSSGTRVPTMLKWAQPSRHSLHKVRVTVSAVRRTSPTPAAVSEQGSGGRGSPRRSTTLTPRQLSRQIAEAGVVGFEPPGRPLPAWSAGLASPGVAARGAAAGPVAPLRLLGSGRGGSRRADGMLPAGVAYSRPAAARAQRAASARKHNSRLPAATAAAEPEQAQGDAAVAGASPVERTGLHISLPLEDETSTLARTSSHSYHSRVGASPKTWRDTATPRPGPAFQVGEAEVVCVVEPKPPRRRGDPPRRPGDAMPVQDRHGAYTTDHLGFLAHIPRGEHPPMRLDGKASRGRRGIANSWEREFKGAATVLRAGLVPLEWQLRHRKQWEVEAC